MVAREGGVGIVDAATGHCVVVLLLWYVWFQWVAAWSGLDFGVYLYRGGFVWMEKARDVWEGVLYEAILKRWSISMWD
jgi:hypothetical protein